MNIKRNLSDACYDCEYNSATMHYCFDMCSVPITKLLDIEDERNKSDEDINNEQT